jgi:hypothetical protein
MTLLTKQCGICSIIKPITEFAKAKTNKDKLKNFCKSCNKIKMKAWHAKNPSHHLIRNYGITVDEKIKMMSQQNSCCAICNSHLKDTTEAHVDHCHNSKAIRGILCGDCNRAIGLFKDSTELLKQAANYLKKYAKPNTTPPVPKGTYFQSVLDTERGAILATGIGQNSNDTDNYSGTVSGEDVNHRPQTSGGDSMGTGN